MLVLKMVGPFIHAFNWSLSRIRLMIGAPNNGTAATATKLVQFLNYAASNPNAMLRYKSSQMVLHAHSDASYLSAP